MSAAPRDLVVLAHPNPHSYTAAMAALYCDELRAMGHEVELRDLYRSPVAPTLESAEYAASRAGKYAPELAAEHRALLDADGITLVFPLWWMGPPALLKGWIDRVLAYGVAYTMKGETSVPLLGGRRAATLVTMGTAREDYEADGSLAHMSALWDRHVFGFCGLRPTGHAWLGDAALADDAARAHHREELRALARAQAAAA